MEILNNFIWLIIGIILAIVIPIIKQVLRNKVQRNRIKFFVCKEKEFDGLFLKIRDKTGLTHTIVCDDDFSDFGISRDITELMYKNLNKGESKRIYLDVE